MVFLKLLLAHLITDFLSQTEYSVEREKPSGLRLLAHAAIFVALSVLLFASTIGQSNVLPGIFALGVAHYIIDWTKTSFFKDQITAFLLDQGAHLLLLGAVAVFIAKNMSFPALLDKTLQLPDSPKAMVFLTFLLLATFGGNVIIGKIIQPFAEQIDRAGKTEKPGMQYAGAYIGILERLLIFALILAGNLAAIGFVFAAKSLIRFPESKEEHHFAEYFLIGTMTSFTYAITVGLAAQYLLRHLH